MNELVHLPILLRMLRKLPIPRKLGLLERVFGKSLQGYGICRVETSTGIVWKLDLTDVTERWIVYGDYEGSLQMNWIRHWLEEGGVVIDSGVNIGQMLLFMAPLPGVTVHGFEPLPEAYKWVTECLNHYPGWLVTMNRYGLSSGNSTITVQVDGARSTARMDWYKGKNFPVIEITVKTLDEYLHREGIERVRLWKLDVEGHELEALAGVREHLQNHTIDAILIEVSSHLEVSDYLKEFGYVLHVLNTSGKLEMVTEKMAGTHNMIAMPIE